MARLNGPLLLDAKKVLPDPDVINRSFHRLRRIKSRQQTLQTNFIFAMKVQTTFGLECSFTQMSV
jgi:hypothetical protein